MKYNRIFHCFPGGKHKVLTMSYDDGKREDRALVKIFNAHGIRGTFNLNAGLIPSDADRISLEEIAGLYKGHEVASHTLTHPTIGRCDLAHVARQILDDREMLEKATGRPVRGLAYPNGSFTPEIEEMLPALGIRYGRVVETTGTFALPNNPYEWKGTCHHNGNLLEKCEEFLSLKKTQYLYAMYVWGHSYEFSDAGNWDVMEKFCAAAGGKSDIWYATNIEIIDWQDTMRRLQFAADGSFVYNPSSSDAWLSVDGETVRVVGGSLVRL